MRVHVGLFCLLGLCSSLAFGAQNFDQIIAQAQSGSARYLQEAQGVSQKYASSHAVKRPMPQAILFVSFSMPDLAMKQYFVQSQHYKIPMVVRGLIGNSFKKTANKVYALSKKGNIGGVAIDPNWFRTFDIKVVPALVVTKGGCQSKAHCPKDQFDVVYGNIPIKKALETIREKGTNTNGIASLILKEHDHA